MIVDALLDAVKDSLKLLPFLFLTYLLMEYIEHRAGDKAEKVIARAGRFGPLAGGLLGIFPQCGFSAAASGLYAGGVVTAGTLIAVFLSTSDEMLPLMIGSRIPLKTVLLILSVKCVWAVIVGFATDVLLRRKERREIVDLCREEGCHCDDESVFRSALHHTVHIFFYILLFTAALNILVSLIGEESISRALAGFPLLSNVVAGIIGLVPNCAASVLLTRLYLDGVVSAGAMMSGLFVGAGVGLLVLFRMNGKIKDSLRIVSILFVAGTLGGILLDLVHFGAVC